jgi:hypothetical protein
MTWMTYSAPTGMPSSASLSELSDEFFLFGINADHGVA